MDSNMPTIFQNQWTNMKSSMPSNRWMEAELITHLRNGRVMFFIKEGYLVTNCFHSSGSILPSPLRSACRRVCQNLAKKVSWLKMVQIISVKQFTTLSTIASTTSSWIVESNSCRRANTISFNWKIPYTQEKSCNLSLSILEIRKIMETKEWSNLQTILGFCLAFYCCCWGGDYGSYVTSCVSIATLGIHLIAVNVSSAP